MKLLFLASLLLLTSCLENVTKPKRSIKCYSGGALIYEGVSSGSVEGNHHRLEFTDELGASHAIYADCVVTKL